uniref:Secreted protein n=1 Tax=Panagrolaimus sp. JU765 TaxID=591449 RepID=A0AC34QB22_9BILA
MKAILSVVLFGLLIIVIHGFNFGVDQPIKSCEYKDCRVKASIWRDVDVQITVECAGKINPDATIELWDVDDVSKDDLISTFKWTYIHEGNRTAYVDAFATTCQLDRAEYDDEREVELYFKLLDPCLGQQNKEYLIKNVVSQYTFIPE